MPSSSRVPPLPTLHPLFTPGQALASVAQALNCIINALSFTFTFTMTTMTTTTTTMTMMRIKWAWLGHTHTSLPIGSDYICIASYRISCSGANDEAVGLMKLSFSFEFHCLAAQMKFSAQINELPSRSPRRDNCKHVACKLHGNLMCNLSMEK